MAVFKEEPTPSPTPSVPIQEEKKVEKITEKVAAQSQALSPKKRTNYLRLLKRGIEELEKGGE